MDGKYFNLLASGDVQGYLAAIKHSDGLPREREKELAIKIQTSADSSAINELVENNLLFGAKVARKYFNTGIPATDLIGASNDGLYEAAKRFDGSVKFISYSVWWQRQKILQHVNEQSRPFRVSANRSGEKQKVEKMYDKLAQKLMRGPSVDEVAAALGVSEELVVRAIYLRNDYYSLDDHVDIDDGKSTWMDLLKDDSVVDSEDVHLRDNLCDIVHAALDTLPKSEREVLKWKFGFYDDTEYTLEEIGEKVGVCKERVRQVRNKGLKNLIAKKEIKQLIGSY